VCDDEQGQGWICWEMTTLSGHWEFKRPQSVVSLSVILRLFLCPWSTKVLRVAFEGGKGRDGISQRIVPCA